VIFPKKKFFIPAFRRPKKNFPAGKIFEKKISQNRKNPAYLNSLTQNRGGGVGDFGSGRSSNFTPV
jgi:hypothetical protein